VLAEAGDLGRQLLDDARHASIPRALAGKVGAIVEQVAHTAHLSGRLVQDGEQAVDGMHIFNQHDDRAHEEQTVRVVSESAASTLAKGRLRVGSLSQQPQEADKGNLIWYDSGGLLVQGSVATTIIPKAAALRQVFTAVCYL